MSVCKLPCRCLRSIATGMSWIDSRISTELFLHLDSHTRLDPLTESGILFRLPTIPHPVKGTVLLNRSHLG